LAPAETIRNTQPITSQAKTNEAGFSTKLINLFCSSLVEQQ